MPRKKKREQIIQEHQITPVQGDIVKTPTGFYRIKALVERGGRIVATFHPLHLKLEAKDVAQIFIGSIVLASPFMMTQEVWELGQQIPTLNAILIMLMTLFALSVLLYFTRYEKITSEGRIVIREFSKRLFVTYLIAFLTVSTLLTILGKAPWDVDTQVALKRVILIALPASLGGAAVDLLK
ncbi:MAG: DUF2391 family protein [Candidatus Aenigmarchaeota archaeon]|nr:DUF2391 family protein [Candidatus Aenigmarchaeota archaeon]